MKDRIFKLSSFLQPSQGEPIRSVITQTPEAAVVAWFVQSGQRVAPHVHPHGQDTWTVISGHGEYQVDALGRTFPIVVGDVVVAPTGAVHGVLCTSAEPLVFVSVVSPAEAGYWPFRDALVDGQ